MHSSPSQRSTQPTTRLWLVPKYPQHTNHSPLALWHLLSLDAPTVAALWTLFIAHVSGLHLPWPAPAAMFLAVWMIYAADRLLDARLLESSPRSGIEARHLFHHHHRSRFLSAILISALALAYLLHRVDYRALHLYALLATLLSVWMLLIHARPLSDTVAHRLPKELAVGIIFPAAVFIPTIARLPALRFDLFPSALLFACVCTLNCLYLYAWEHPAPRLEAHWTTRWATTHLTRIALVILSLSTLATTLGLAHHNLPAGLPALACALSTGSLLLLDVFRLRISALHLRAAADLVLLTPFPLFFIHFVR